jgi:hypothetical protein
MGRSDEDRSKRAGDVLGLGNAGASGDDITSHQSSEAEGTDQARRRRRMSEGADELTPSTERAGSGKRVLAPV